MKHEPLGGWPPDGVTHDPSIATFIAKRGASIAAQVALAQFPNLVVRASPKPRKVRGEMRGYQVIIHRTDMMQPYILTGGDFDGLEQLQKGASQ